MEKFLKRYVLWGLTYSRIDENKLYATIYLKPLNFRFALIDSNNKSN